MVGNNEYMPFSEAKREKIVLSVLKDNIAVSEVSRNYSVARKTIYSWIKRYKKGSLAPLYTKGRKHPAAVYPKAYSYISRWAVGHPKWGCRTLSKRLNEKGISLSYVQVNRLLNTIGAETYDRRLNYARNFAGPGRTREDVRLEIVKKAVTGKISITTLSENYKVARKTIYKWIAKYRAIGNIKDSYVVGEAHPKAIYPKITQQVLDLVVTNPGYSVRTLAKSFPASSWTIWSILNRNNLNTYNLRLEYSRNISEAAEEKVSTTGVSERIRSVFESFTPNLAPAPPPGKRKIFNFFIISVFLLSISLAIFYWGSVIVHAPNIAGSIGMIFAGVSLSLGMFFFLYSLKYYISTAIVLSYSQKEGLDASRVSATGLNSDLSNIHLERHPYVSVHLALYNEKNVVERLMKAATSFDYDNYEVIIADDSTDETTDKIREFLKTFLPKGESLRQTKGDGWAMTEVDIRSGVVFKHVHRTTRMGYKGGALKLALSLTDPKAEFVSVFDADFVPYPDSLMLFLKYFKLQNNGSEDYKTSNTASVQGYQWHVLNKSENWITRGVRSEYAGSYVIERAGTEIYKGLKQISGSVYMIRRDVLEGIGWGTSITEDFELTLKLYEKGYKVVYTPYIQAPAECVSTLRRLVRQRMRWAEGHSFNVKKMFAKLMFSPKLSSAEKFETVYLAPYYLQALFFLIGTLSWFISETILPARLPFWTELWGWSLVLTNMISLPLLNTVGLFLEESDRKDYSGIPSFIALSYIVVPFQAYAAVKGFLEKEEGPWFRTPKTGRITDVFKRGKFYKFISGILPGKAAGSATSYDLSPYLALTSANNRFSSFSIQTRKGRRWVGKLMLTSMLIISNLLLSFSPYIESRDGNSQPPPGTGILMDGSTKGSGGKVNLTPEQQQSLDKSIKANNQKTSFKLVSDVSAAEISGGSEVNTSFDVKKKDLELSGGNTTFTTDENPQFTLKQNDGFWEFIKNIFIKEKPLKDQVVVTVLDLKGKEVGSPQVVEGGIDDLSINLDKTTLTPGGYTLEIKSGSSPVITQDFSWGVLAINTNKSVYSPGEDASISMGVLNEVGETLCSAGLTLDITDTAGTVTALTTKEGTIKVSDECSLKGFSLKPDYEAAYKTTVAGKYSMVLTAETLNGKYVIKGWFEAKDSVDFDVETITASRINPVYEYPVIFIVKAGKDYNGIVEEKVPAGFEISKLNDLKLNNYLDSKGESTASGKLQETLVNDGSQEAGQKTLRWIVDWKKDQTYVLAYAFKAPMVSPEFYLLGPLWIGAYEGAGGWQIAADKVPAGIIVGWPSTVASIPNHWSRVSGAALDGYFLRSVTATDPSGTPGGNASHTHSPASHTHSVPVHTHTVPAFAQSTNTSATTGNSTGSARDTHTHAAFSSGNSNVTVNNAQTVPFAGLSNDPDNSTVIWIQSDGDPSTEIPVGSYVYFDSNTMPGANWGRVKGNYFLKGAATGLGGGTDTVTGSATHTHAASADHTHTEAAHTHSGSSAGGSLAVSSTGTGSYSPSGHTHTVTSSSVAATEGGASVTPTVGVAAPSGEPPWYKLNIISKSTGANETPLNVIAMWTGTLATIPDGWVICDGTNGTPNLGTNFIKGANADGELNTTGGSLTHTHGAGNTHTHTINAHVHTWTVGAASGTGVGLTGNGRSAVVSTHTHTLSAAQTSSGGGSTGTATITADSQSNLPLYKEVAYIMYIGKTVAGKAYSDEATSIWAGCDNSTARISLVVNGGTASTTSCSSSDGSFSFKNVTHATDNPISVFFNTAGSNADKGVAVTIANDATTPITLNPRKNIVWMRSEKATPTITNSNLAHCYASTPASCANVPYSASGANITLTTGVELHVESSMTYDPGGTTATTGTGSLHVDDNAVAYLDTTGNTIANNILVDAGATIHIDASTAVNGGNITVTGNGIVSSAAGTVTMGASGTIGGGSTGSTFQLTDLVVSSGTTTLGTDADNILDFTGDINVSAGAVLAMNNKTANVDGGNLTTTSTGSVTCSGCTTGGLTISGVGTTNGIGGGGGAITLYNLTLDGSTNTTTVGSSAITVTNDVTIGTGRTLSGAASGTIYVGHNWANSGTYNANSGTINLNAAADTVQQITGATTFYNLYVATGDRIIKFGSSTAFTIDTGGTFTATGDSCSALVVIRSTTSGSAATITKTGSVSFSYIDIQDINFSASASASNSVDSGNNSSIVIAANSCLGASTNNQAATGHSFQRKVFYDSGNNVYWGFYHDGTQIEVRYSSNSGSTWNVENDHLVQNTNDFSVWDQTISSYYVFLAAKSSDSIVLRRGTITSGAISWDSETTPVTAFTGTGSGDSYSYPYISADSSGNLWVGARYFNGSSYVYKAVKSNNAGSATWTNAAFTWGDPSQISNDQADPNVFGNVVSIGSLNMYATFVVGTTIKGCKYTNSPPAWKNSAGTDSCVTTEGSGGGESTYFDSLSTGLVAYWKMNETSWTGASNEVVDSSGNGNNGTRVGDATTTAAGFYRSGTFDGTGDRVSVPDKTDWTLSSGIDLTYSTWINYTVLPGSTNWPGIVEGGDDMYGFQMNGPTTGNIVVDWWDGTVDHTSSSQAVSVGTWYHVVITLDFGVTNGSHWYFNGRDLGTFTAQDRSVNPDALYIGGSVTNPVSNNAVNGKIDDLRIYNRLLSGEEVAKLYQYAPDRVNIDDASDFNAPSGRQVVRAKNGDLYTFVNDAGTCGVWKSTDGASWSEQDSTHHKTCMSYSGVSIAIDSTDKLHLLYASGSNTLQYDTFTAGAFSILNENIYNDVGGNGLGGFDIAVDANNIPHVVYVYIDTFTDNQLGYDNRVGGAWNGSDANPDTDSVGLLSPTIEINETGYPEVSYIKASTGVLVAKAGNGNDPNLWAGYSIDTSVNVTGGQGGASIAVDTLTGNTWIAYVDGDNDISLAKYSGTDYSGWETAGNWATVTSKSDDGYDPSIAITGPSDIYVFYQDDGVADNGTNKRISYDIYDSIGEDWAGEVPLQTPSSGDFKTVKAKWSFEWNNYGANRIDYLFSDGTDVFWSYLYLRRQPTNIDDASNMGALPGEGRQVVRTSSGYLYSFIAGKMWKSTDGGATWAQKGASKSGIFNTLAVGSDDTLHVTFGTSTTGIFYDTFSTSSEAFAGLNQSIHAYTAGESIEDSVSMALDSNDIPHVVYIYNNSGATDTFLIYDSKVGGSWHTHYLVLEDNATGGTTDIFSPEITINESDYPEVVEYNAMTGTVRGKAANANAATAFATYVIDDSVVGTPTIGIDSSGNTWVAYADSGDKISLAKYSGTDFTGWYTSGNWAVNTSKTQKGYKPSIVVDGTNIRVLYQDDQNDIVYDTFNGTSWSGETLLEEHAALQDVKARGSFLNNYDSTGVAQLKYNTYYFNTYDGELGDPNGVWGNDASAFDGNTGTSATSGVNGSTSSNYLMGTGTSAPASGETISSVQVRFYGGQVVDSNTTVYATVSSGGTEIGTATIFKLNDPAWSGFVTLSAPGGSWDWSEVQGLNVKLYATGIVTGSVAVRKVEIQVKSTSTTSQAEVDYVYSDGTDVFYNRLLLGGTSSISGTQDPIDDLIPADISKNISTVADGSGNVHILYIKDSATDYVAYKKWNGTSWDVSPTSIESNANAAYLTLSRASDTGDLYALWIDTSANTIRKSIFTSSWSGPTAWQNPGVTITNLSSSYSASAVFSEWTIGALAPFEINAGVLKVPEYLLLFLPLAPLLPFLSRVKKKRGALIR